MTGRRDEAARLVLVGCGKMGAALLGGWLESGVTGPDHAVIVEPQPGKDAKGFAALGVALRAAAEEIPAGFQPHAVVLAVKPQVMAGVLPAYGRFATPDTVFLSIAAGKTTTGLAGILDAGGGRAAGASNPHIVRAMPNTPAAVRRGMTVLIAGPGVTGGQRGLCERLMGAVGEVAWVADEALLDAVTAVSGSGPAFFFLLVEALAAAGAKAGLPDALAKRLARATLCGSGALLERTGEQPETLRRNVTSPGGTTAAALEILNGPGGLAPLIERAVDAATRRTRELAG